MSLKSLALEQRRLLGQTDIRRVSLTQSQTSLCSWMDLTAISSPISALNLLQQIRCSSTDHTEGKKTHTEQTDKAEG
ncbi:uncharacterized [Tachysurus ichikawai]